MNAKLIIFLLIGIIIGMMLGGILSPTIAQEENYQLGDIKSYLSDISSRTKNIESYLGDVSSRIKNIESSASNIEIYTKRTALKR
jgi:hypothetical protein